MKKYKTKNMNLQLFANDLTPCYLMWDNLISGTYHIKPFVLYGKKGYNTSIQTFSETINYITISKSNDIVTIEFKYASNSETPNKYRFYIGRLTQYPNDIGQTNAPIIWISSRNSGGVLTYWDQGTIFNYNKYPLQIVSYNFEQPPPTNTNYGYWYITSDVTILDYANNTSVCGIKLVQTPIKFKKVLKINNKIIEKFNNKNINKFNDIEVISGI